MCVCNLGDLKSGFDLFCKNFSQNSDTCKYWDGMVILAAKPKTEKTIGNKGFSLSRFISKFL